MTLELPDKVISLQDLEKIYIEKAIDIKNGNILQLAWALGLSYRGLGNKILKYGLKPAVLAARAK